MVIPTYSIRNCELRIHNWSDVVGSPVSDARIWSGSKSWLANWPVWSCINTCMFITCELDDVDDWFLLRRPRLWLRWDLRDWFFIELILRVDHSLFILSSSLICSLPRRLDAEECKQDAGVYRMIFLPELQKQQKEKWISCSGNRAVLWARKRRSSLTCLTLMMGNLLFCFVYFHILIYSVSYCPIPGFNWDR